MKEAPSRKPSVIIAHPGTQHAPRLAKQLANHGYLMKYITVLLWTDSSLLIRILKKIAPSIYYKLSTRVIPNISPDKISTVPTIEITGLINKTLNKHLSENDYHYQRNKDFQLSLRNKQFEGADIVIGYDTASWILVDLVKASGKKFILDQSIGHPAEMAKVNSQLNVLFPDWAEHITEKSDKFLALEQEEYEKASYIVVASSFSKDTLVKNGIDNNKIFLNPYGVDLTRFNYHPRKTKEKIVFLFIGSVNVRKGIPFLAESWEEAKLENAELWIVGPVADDVRVKLERHTNLKVLGKIVNAQLTDVMQQADVFVFPSFFEGFGLVILEAMASGLPVLTTTATAGPDLIENGKEGFVISPGNSAELIKALRYFYDNREQIKLMGNSARRKAEDYTWNEYGKRWEAIINSVISL